MKKSIGVHLWAYQNLFHLNIWPLVTLVPVYLGGNIYKLEKNIYRVTSENGYKIKDS
jgi:hypothetical protein